MGCGTCETFEIIGESSTITLNKPELDAEDNSLDKDIDRFDLWDNDYEVVDKGINDDALTLSGIETVCESESGLCFPLCFPFCFKDVLVSKFVTISNMMKDHEKVEISGLGDNVDGIYVISSFTYKSLHSSVAFAWNLTLDFVRDS